MDNDRIVKMKFTRNTMAIGLHEAANFARGWVYVMSNDAMPGLVKIGYSMKDPLIRASELNHTGVPMAYKVEGDILVSGPRIIEQLTHQHLRELCEGKEWFRMSAKEAFTAILDTLERHSNHRVYLVTQPEGLRLSKGTTSAESVEDFWNRHMPTTGKTQE